VRVRIWQDADALLFEVSDDGAGFETSRHAEGAGLTNMRDRLGAAGGTLRVESDGHGTRIQGVVPIDGASVKPASETHA
jgi:signal transduction histidine kinase